jgi:hypothetical protein
MNRIAQGKMRINSRKIQIILERVRTAPKCIFETFCTQEAPRCIGMNATHKTIYLISENNQGFLYTIFPIKKINVGKILNL